MELLAADKSSVSTNMEPLVTSSRVEQGGNAEQGGSEEEEVEETWCEKRFVKQMVKDGRKSSGGIMWMFRLCGYPFPPMEMVGAESLTLVSYLV